MGRLRLAKGPETVFSTGDEGRLIEELRNLKSRRTPRQSRTARAMQILERTVSARVRNAAALALADLRARSAKDALIDLLKRQETKGSRGTLLYALGELGADLPLPVLADIIADDSYEAREEALTFLASGRIEGSAEEVARARAMLDAALPSADAERSQAIRRALEYLLRDVRFLP
jgi:HEAT repeat protein